MKKKVLYIWKSAYPWDVRIEKICNSMSLQNYDVYIICKWGGEEKERETIGGINIIRIGFNEISSKYIPVSFNLFWKKAINNAVNEIKPHLIIVREIMLATASAKIGKKNNIPVLMDMAENYPAVMKGWKKYNSTWFRRFLLYKVKLADRIERNSLKYIDGVITVCQEQNERLTKVYNFNKEFLFVLHNTPSINLNKIIEKNIDDTKDLPNTENNKKTINLGYHGFVNTERNLEILIDAVALLDNSKYLLNIYGDGPELESIKKYAEDYSNIHIYGKYDHSELKRLYLNTDIGILPYVIDDHINNTISNKLFDYMAYGIPVVVADAIPMRRIVEEGNCGIVADCSNPKTLKESIELIVSKDLDKMGKNAFEFYKSKYNWEYDFNNFIKFLNTKFNL